MYVYIRSNNESLWVVGFFKADGSGWTPESDHETRESAAARVNYLNGGSGSLQIQSAAETNQFYFNTALSAQQALQRFEDIIEEEGCEILPHRASDCLAEARHMIDLIRKAARK